MALANLFRCASFMQNIKARLCRTVNLLRMTIYKWFNGLVFTIGNRIFAFDYGNRLFWLGWLFLPLAGRAISCVKTT